MVGKIWFECCNSYELELLRLTLLNLKAAACAQKTYLATGKVPEPYDKSYYEV